MNFLSKTLLAVFLLKCFYFLLVGVGQAYSVDHLILQALDTENNLAIICQEGGSLCSNVEVEVVSFDDLDSDQKDQVVEMIASSAMDRSSYSSTLDSDQYSNFLSHSDEISYSSHSISRSLVSVGSIVGLTSVALLLPNIALTNLIKHKVLPGHTVNIAMISNSLGMGLAITGISIMLLGFVLSAPGS